MNDESMKNRLEGLERTLKIMLVLIFVSMSSSLVALAITLYVLITTGD
jgi:hypothetical protein